MTKLLEEICKLPTYSLECHGYQGDEMFRQQPFSMEYTERYNQVSGDWFSTQDILNLLKQYGLI